jgi:hypothetical protein
MTNQCQVGFYGRVFSGEFLAATAALLASKEILISKILRVLSNVTAT